ncbi:hypothetical protein F4778DRAFT_524057 [Xylariomycetidae sp. FL2044]|nr:hypothetical protein F4778DRAFT_524057 [Xylariomycetidae sp. FL2044]
MTTAMEARLYGDALTSESDQNDDDALIAGKSNPRPSTQLMKPRYANTAVGDPREMGLVKGDEMYEESDHSSDLMQEETAFSKEKEERRRIAALHSQGIVVYDPISVRSEPEIFDWKTAPSQSRQKVSKDRELCVWDYLIEDVDVSKVVENDFKEFLHQGNPVPAHETGSNPQGSGLSTAFSTDVEAENVHRNAHRQTKSTIQTQDTRYSKNPDDTDSVPFLQWQAGEPSGIVTNNDYDMVIRVLDGVNEELFNSNVTAHHKYYRKSNQNTFRDLEGYRNILLDTTHPFHANLEEDLPESSRAGAARVHADKIMVWRRKETTELKLRFCSVVTRLVENFLPIDLEHETMKRLRGRMLTLFEAMDQIFLTETAATNSLYYVQLDYENDDDLQQYFLLNRPKRTFKGCENCSDRGYKTLEDGVAHLRSEHFDYALDMDGQVAGRSISVYLRTLSQIQVETRVGTIMSLMRTTESMLEDIFGRVDILKKGATSLRRSGERKQYPVMAKLVKVFGLVVLLIVLMGHFGVTVDKLLRRSIHNIQDGKKLLAKQVRSLRHVHHTAIKQLDGARVDLILASKTESWSGGVTVTSIGPEFMIALMSKRLFLRQLRDGPSDEEPQRAAVDTLEVYKQHMTRIQFQVNQRPRKSLFVDMYSLEEELDILQRVIRWQSKFCTDLIRVLDPTSFKTTTKGRITHFMSESRYISKILTRLQAREREVIAMQDRTGNLRVQLKQSIEIREESHTKAIRVFTFVTVLFLPL